MNGTRVYVRLFNAPTVAASTAWGQSATFLVQGVAVMDVSALGLTAATIPAGVDLNTVDAKGLTYLQELIANTNPFDPTDRFQINAVTPAVAGSGLSLNVTGRAGRQYEFERTTDDLSAPPVWTPIITTGPLTLDENLIFSDPNPPQSPKAFYRVRVSMP